jgi:hypothetical protein
MVWSGRNARVRVPLLLVLGCLSAGSMAQVSIFNSASSAGNAAARNAWLAAAGILAPDNLEDFESYGLGTNLSGSLLSGGLTITDLHASPFAQVQSASSFFGGSVPIGKGLALKENHKIQFDFAAPTSYFGILTMDDGGSDVRIYLDDNTTVDFNNLDTAGSSGANSEFLGFYSNGPKIVKIDYYGQGGDGEWGIDNVQYAAVPEPGTLVALGAGAALLASRRRRKAV